MTDTAHANESSSHGDARAELARLTRAVRLVAALEREGGVVTLPGQPRPADPDEPPPISGSPREAAAEAARRAAGAATRPASPLPGASSQRPASPAPRARPATPTQPEPLQRQPVPAPRRDPPPARATGGARLLVRPLDLGPDALASFGDLPARVDACRACSLGETRTCAVFGEGSPTADLVFCGEAPGFDEDRSGRPFVGKAGELLTAMIERGMGLRREEVFILNTLKCRPPRNRAPLPIEVSACRPHLEAQLAVLRPKVIVALGNHAVRALIGESPGISRIRGQVLDALGTKVVPTFHPAYLLRNPAAKRDAWHDLQVVMKLLGIERP